MNTIPFVDLEQQRQRIAPQLNARIQAVIEHGQYILGPEVGELERVLAEFTGAKHCIGMASGTDALLVALMALGVGHGDEVITTPFSFIATAETIALLGAAPVFVDIRPDTYNLNEALLEQAITRKTKAIIPVSLYGQCADYDAINAVAETHRIPVIEDAAQSLGATYKGRQSCNLTTIGCTSFFPSKPLGCYGDAGACFTNDDELASIMTQIRAHGQAKRYYHARIGVNARIDTLQAAILLAKFDIFADEVKRRERVGSRYSNLINDAISHGTLPETVVAPAIAQHNTSVYAQYTLRVPNRDQVQEKLKSVGVPTAVHYPVPLNQQPALQGYKIAPVPQADLAAQQVMSLPMHPYLSEQDQDYIVNALADALSFQ